MKIVVMCGNLIQFNNYVQSMLQDESKLPIKRTITKKGCNQIVVHIDDLEFIYCSCPYILKGRSFSKDDYMVKIGTWYELSTKTQEEIVTEFMARKGL